MNIERIKGILLYRSPIVEVYSVMRNLFLHLKYSFKTGRPLDDKQSYIFYLTKSFHIIEKGLTLPNPKQFFGESKIKKSLIYAQEYIEKYGFDYHVDNINSALKDYVIYHEKFAKKKESCLISHINEYLDSVKSRGSSEGNGGIELIDTNSTNFDFSFDEYIKFINSRRSIRDFSSQKVIKEDIYKTISLSLKTPSVCNRQGWRAYAYFERDKIDSLLKMQNGNAGFGNQIPCLLIVVGRSKAFSRFEYNQLYTDAGMFSMNIINSLHALNLGSCPLNLCMNFNQEIKLKKLGEIPYDERLVMMIAVGHRKEEYIVAKSPRMELKSILKIK